MVSLALGVLLAQGYPDPVTGVGVALDSPTSVTLTWTLPPDPSIVGVTIYREELDDWDHDVVFVLNGLQTTFTDTSVSPYESYRYWIHTRDGDGDLSYGVWAEVIGYDDDDDDDWYIICWASSAAGSGPGPWTALAAALSLGVAFLRRR